MKIQLLLFCLFTIAFSGNIWAQDTLSLTAESTPAYRHAVFLEAGGNAVVGSVNYERFVELPGKGPTVSLRVGMLPMPARENKSTSYLHLFVPLELTLIPRKKGFSPEFGVGVTIMNTYTRHKLEANEFSQDAMPVYRFGFRWRQKNGPFFWRAGLLLLKVGAVDGFVEGATWPWVSYCVGYNVGKRKAVKSLPY